MQKGHILVTSKDNGIRVSSYIDTKMELTMSIENSGDLVGNVYVGYVENIVDNLNAAFVRFTNDNSNPKDNIGYLPFSEINERGLINRASSGEKKLKRGDFVLVQILKPAVKTKQVFLTMNISIGASYLALTLGRGGIGMSKKIPEKKAATLYSKFKKDFTIKSILDENYGIVVRTKAEKICDDKSLFESARSEAEIIYKQIEEMIKISSSRKIGTCLYKKQNTEQLSDVLDRSYYFLRRYLDVRNIDKKHVEGDFENNKNTMQIENISDDKNNDFGIAEDLANICISKEPEIDIISDDMEIFEMISDTDIGKLGDIDLRLYTEKDGNLNVIYSINSQLKDIQNKKVWLKSGGYLVIEQTEAMNVIDVNSGKNIKQKGDLFYEINDEAVEETFRQIRLRNLSGMIMIDFINMKTAAEYKRLQKKIETFAGLDPIYTQFVDFTGLKIAEIIRSKK